MYGDDLYDDFGPYTSEVEDLNDFDDMDEFIDDYDDLEADMEEGVLAYGGSSIYEDAFGDDDLDDDDDDDFGDDDDDLFGVAGAFPWLVAMARRNKRYARIAARYSKNKAKAIQTGKRKFDRKARRQMARLLKMWPRIRNKSGLYSPAQIRQQVQASARGGVQQAQVQQAAMTTNYARRQAARPMPRPMPMRRRRRRMIRQQQQARPDFMQNPQYRPFRPPMGRPMRPMRPMRPGAPGRRFGAEEGMSTTKKVAAGLGIFALGVLASGPVMDIIDDIRY